MNQLRKLTIFAFVFALCLFMSGCAVNKKKKCDTCPKWTSSIINTDIEIIEMT